MTEQPICKLLPWDTEFFGFPIARLQREQVNQAVLADASAWCRDNHIRCLYYLSPAEDTPSLLAAQLAGFHFIDVRLTLAQHLSKKSTWPNDKLIIRQTVAADRAEIIALAPHLARVSRFGADPRFGWGKAVALYEQWLQKEAAVTLVAEVANGIGGIISCDKSPEDMGIISLLAANPNHSGHGVGTALCRAGLNWMAAQGCSGARVVTQGHNIASQRLYQHAGFLTQSVEIWFHKWFDNA